MAASQLILTLDIMARFRAREPVLSLPRPDYEEERYPSLKAGPAEDKPSGPCNAHDLRARNFLGHAKHDAVG